MATATRTLGGRRAALAVLVACAAQFLIGADGLAVAIALPALQSDLGVAPIDAQWILTAYGSPSAEACSSRGGWATSSAAAGC
jgi:hypothetical protein